MERSPRRTLTLIALVAVATISCGPPLTDPADTDVTGTWFATGPASGMTNITVVLAQQPDGSISGTYKATGTLGLQFCPDTRPCPITGTVSGSNTVFQIFFELKDAGQFTGQFINGTEMRGAMNRASTTQPILFTRS